MKGAAMNCEEARQAWHLGFEDGQANDKMKQHLRQCAACAEYVADMERITGALVELKAETEGVVSLRQAHQADAPRGYLRIARIAAAIALVAGLYGAYVASLRQPVVEDPSIPAVVATQHGTQVGGDSADELALGVTLQGSSAQNLLAVASPTANPNVQLYWLYPRLGATGEDAP